MKKSILFLGLYFILFSCQTLKAQNLDSLMVIWCSVDENDFNFIILEEKVLKSISKNELTAYDENWKPIPSVILEKKIKSEVLKKFNKILTVEECAIAIMCGDLSVFTVVTSNYSPKELNKMASEGVDIKKYLSYRDKPMLVNNMPFDFVEIIKLDTTKKVQAGNYESIVFRLTDALHSFFFQIKYSDFEKLNFQPELKAMQERAFYVTNTSGNIRIKIQNGTTIDFSSQFKKDKNPDLDKLNKTPFKYFKGQVRLYDMKYKYFVWED